MPLIINDEELMAEVKGNYGTIFLYYTVPTNKDRPKYLAATAKVTFGSVSFWKKKGEARYKAGFKLLAGFKVDDDPDLDFIHWQKGEDVKFSSNRKNEHYTTDWRNIFAKYFGDYIESLGTALMDGATVETQESADEYPEEDDTEKNSQPTSPL